MIAPASISFVQFGLLVLLLFAAASAHCFVRVVLPMIARFTANCDAWIIGGAVKIIVGTIWAISIAVRTIQIGSVRSYMFAMVMGLIGFLGYYLYLARHSIR
jgi:hypothetical protein